MIFNYISRFVNLKNIFSKPLSIQSQKIKFNYHYLEYLTDDFSPQKIIMLYMRWVKQSNRDDFIFQAIDNIFCRCDKVVDFDISSVNSISASKSCKYSYRSFGEFARKRCWREYPLDKIGYDKNLRSFKHRYICDKRDEDPLLSFYITELPKYKIVHFCNWDASHRFALIVDYLTRNKKQELLKAKVTTYSINSGIISSLESKYHSFILENSFMNRQFFLNKNCAIFTIFNRDFKQEDNNENYLSLINVDECLIVFLIRDRANNRLAEQLDKKGIQRWLPTFLPN